MKQFIDDDKCTYTEQDLKDTLQLDAEDKADILNLEKGEMILINTTWIKRIK